MNVAYVQCLGVQCVCCSVFSCLFSSNAEVCASAFGELDACNPFGASRQRGWFKKCYYGHCLLRSRSASLMVSDCCGERFLGGDVCMVMLFIKRCHCHLLNEHQIVIGLHSVIF